MKCRREDDERRLKGRGKTRRQSLNEDAGDVGFLIEEKKEKEKEEKVTKGGKGLQLGKRGRSTRRGRVDFDACKRDVDEKKGGAHSSLDLKTT